jgi:rhodanese-related sulfurtransferase
LETSQLIIYGLLVIVLFLYARKYFVSRSLTHYSAQEASERVKSGAAVILDVRTAAERQSSSIRGSLHIPVHELSRRSDELKKVGGKEIICYCATGSRSVSATITLRKLGFTTANMKGGIAEWNFSGLK